MQQPVLPTSPSEAGQLPAAAGAEVVEGHTVAPGDAEHGGGGLPQFNVEYWGGQMIWLVLLFAILYALLSKVFIPRLRKVVETREAAIEGALAAARQVQAEANLQSAEARAQVEEARSRAGRMAADAKAAAAAERARRTAAEEAVLAQRLSEAEGRIAAARGEAMSNVKTIAADTAEAIVERLTGRAASQGELAAAMPASGARIA